MIGLLFRVAVDISRAALRVHYLLSRVQAVVAAEHIADDQSYREEDQTLAAEELYGQDDRGYGAVDHRAEQRYQPHRGAELSRQTQERSYHRAHGRADEEGRDDLAALVAEAYGYDGEHHLEDEVVGQSLAVYYGIGYHIAADTVVAVAEYQCEQNYRGASYGGAEVLVFQIFCRRLVSLFKSYTEDHAHHRRRYTDDRRQSDIRQVQRGKIGKRI